MTRFVAVALCAALAGCKPTLDDTSALVTSPRVLAVRSEPAEIEPGSDVALTALYVDASGARMDAPIDWALCTARKPLTELGPVSPLCLVPTADWLIPLGAGPAATATIPKDACRDFGPDTPDAKPGEPPGRAVDPDHTGGYYQPIRLMLGPADQATFAVAETRLTCGLAGASQDDLALYQKSRRPNANPALDSVSVTVGAAPLVLADGGAFDVAAGARATLSAGWPICPLVGVAGDGICSADEDPKVDADDCKDLQGCRGAEVYGLFDPTTRANVLRTEAMRVSWFATAGTFDGPHTGPIGETAISANGWTAPAGPANVTIWIVVRDDRGGVGWVTLTARVP